ncbi:MAG: RNA polymerase sigma factor [Gemmatales bacterium]
MAAHLPWDELVPLHYAALFRYAYRLTGSRSDAEDLTQEAFCSAQAKQSQLREPERVKSWLFSILHNAFLLQQRRRRQARFHSWDEWVEQDITMAEAAELPVEVEQLQAALMEIPDTFRAVLVLYYFEEFSYQEIADQLKIPLGTVMSRLARAKRFLKTRLLSRDRTLEHEE